MWLSFLQIQNRPANCGGLLAAYETTKAGNAGYFLYQSLENFHTFLSEFHDSIAVNALRETLQNIWT